MNIINIIITLMTIITIITITTIITIIITWISSSHEYHHHHHHHNHHHLYVLFFPNTNVHENIYMPYLYIYIHNLQTTMVKYQHDVPLSTTIFFINIHTQKQKHKQHVNVKIDTAENITTSPKHQWMIEHASKWSQSLILFFVSFRIIVAVLKRLGCTRSIVTSRRSFLQDFGNPNATRAARIGRHNGQATKQPKNNGPMIGQWDSVKPLG